MHTLYQIGIWALDIWLAMSAATFIFFGALYTVRTLRERAYREERLARRAVLKRYFGEQNLCEDDSVASIMTSFARATVLRDITGIGPDARPPLAPQ